MSSRNLPTEFLRSVFELLKDDETTAWSVSQVCKKWRQAALDCNSLWAENFYLNPEFGVLYRHIMPRIRDRKIENLILSSSAPIFFWNPLDHIRPRTPIFDPHLSTKFSVTIPSLLPRVRNLKLEVPSSSWHLLENLFKWNDISHIERLELSRLHVSKDDSPDIQHYTCSALNLALKTAIAPWNLRSLHLHGCTLELNSLMALWNLEELSLYNIPIAAAYTPHAVIAFLRVLPALKRLQLTWATKWHLGYFERFDEPLRMDRLESISITDEVDSCTFLFTSLSLRPTCKVQIIITSVSSSVAFGVSFVERHLVAIVSRHRLNGGSPSTKIASLQVGSEVCGLQCLDSNDTSIPASSPSFFLVLFIDESSTPAISIPPPPSYKADGRKKVESLGRFTLVNLLRKVTRIVFPILNELRLNVDLGLIDQQDLSKTRSTYYVTQFNITRAEFPHLSKLTMKYPSGELVWPDLRSQ